MVTGLTADCMSMTPPTNHSKPHPKPTGPLPTSTGSASVETHPVQTCDGRGGKLSKAVTMRAYEVYCHLYGKQDALVTGWCRGGMSTGEIIAFLYARSFHPSEWNTRVHEAFNAMEHI